MKPSEIIAGRAYHNGLGFAYYVSDVAGGRAYYTIYSAPSLSKFSMPLSEFAGAMTAEVPTDEQCIAKGMGTDGGRK